MVHQATSGVLGLISDRIIRSNVPEAFASVVHGSKQLSSGLLMAQLVLLTACGSGRTEDPFAAARDVDPPSFDATQVDPNLVTREEILSRGQNAPSAMALIRRLRPRWLAPRGQASFRDSAASYPVVYVDEIRHGGLPTLYGIPTAEILEIEYYNTADATTRWGTGHTAGVINIVTGRF